MNRTKIRHITYASIVAALYIVLTYISSLLGLSSGAFQVRFSEALCVLPVFLPQAVPGLFIGCLLSNLLTGGAMLDVIFGSIATLIGALLTRALRKRPVLSLSAPIISNTLIIPSIIRFVYGSEESMILIVLGVFIGEVISCGVLGFILSKYLDKVSFFKKDV